MSAHKKVMIVDDEEGVRLSFDRYLSEHGFDVTTAADGEKAISKLRQEEMDAVVADLKMPGVDGIELLRWMHDEQPETPFILLTGYGNAEVERKVRELGAYEYLNKPISPDALSAVLTAATVLKILPDRTAHVVDERTAEPEPTEAVETAPEPGRLKAGAMHVLEVAGGLIMAPLLGLAFVLFLPVIGFGTLIWTVGEKIRSMLQPSEA